MSVAGASLGRGGGLRSCGAFSVGVLPCLSRRYLVIVKADSPTHPIAFKPDTCPVLVSGRGAGLVATINNGITLLGRILQE